MLRWPLPATTLAITAATAALLTGCGGGGNAAPLPTAPPTVPPSPKASFQIATSLITGSQPSAVRVGPNKTIWFIDRGTRKIDSMDAKLNATVSTLNTTQGQTQNETPNDLSPYDTVNQAFWYSEFDSSAGGSDIASIVGSHVTPPSLSLGNSYTFRAITVSPAGIVWADAASTIGGDEIYEYVPATGAVSGVALGPEGVTIGPDQARRFAFDGPANLWVSERSHSDLLKIDQAAGVAKQRINLQVNGTPTQPTDIALGPDGNLWVADYDGYIYKVDPVSGASTAFPISSGCGATSITSDASRNSLWFADNRCNKIGKITTSGRVTEYASTVTGGKPYSIAVDSDGNVWYSDQGKNQIIRMTPP